MIDVGSLGALVGTVTLQRGLDYARRGAVSRVQITEDPLVVRGQIAGSGRQPYQAEVTLKLSGPKLVALTGICSCPVGLNCKHVTALVLAGLPQRTGRPPAAVWERLLAPLIEEVDTEPSADPPLALQFQLHPAEQPAGRFPYRDRPPMQPMADRLAVRPVQLGAGGRWQRTGIGWSNLVYAARGTAERAAQLDWFLALSALADSPAHRYYGPIGAWLQLGDVTTGAFWDLLAGAAAVGVPLVGSDRAQREVVLEPEPVELVLDVASTGPDLIVRALVVPGGPAAGSELMIGDPVRAMVCWPDEEDRLALRDRGLRLSRFAAVPADELVALLAAGPQRIPAAEHERFLGGYLPALRRRVEVTSRDGSFEIPVPPPPALWLTVDLLADHRTQLHWWWRYAGTQRQDALWAAGRVGAHRDVAAEQRILAELPSAVQQLPELFDAGRLIGEVILTGMQTVALVELLPELEAWPELHLEVRGTASYRAADNAPVIGLSGRPADGRDWFDLDITVTVDGEPVPLREVFLALAAGQDQVILPSGTYFRLDSPTFSQLRRLIDEAALLQDPDAKTLRVSRFQAGWWQELQALGVVDEQAAQWHRQIGGLTGGTPMIRQQLPADFRADLRPYQQEGVDWLCFLFDAGLGGILADDMGLGKTIQALALISHAAARPGVAPFLVVAPTSVVGNWQAEARKFAPQLQVAVVIETTGRAGIELSELVSGADVVVTSYALFRLEFEKYSAQEWAGLILDEAQFVKNSQSLGFKNAKSLTAPFKLAITGTPMENNLMELWSLFSITAPGLFPHPTRFNEYYRTPIEKLRDTDKLAALRRRIRPLMLRRTKEQVASDLPAKQEQVLELALNPRHQKIYQTHLQRERKKVLGLVGDLDKNRFTIFRSLTLLRQLSLDASLVDEKYAGVPSTKLDALLEQLEDVVAEGHRVLVFSQFTSFLAKVRARLDDAGIDHCYLDGHTRRRQEVVEQFTSGAAPVFLISLKAGGFGLNLTEADYCILLDPWWNPATEAQAVDRAHRIGQTRTVMVYRMVAKGTIEEKVMALKAGKSALFSSVMTDDAADSTALTADDIRGLFS